MKPLMEREIRLLLLLRRDHHDHQSPFHARVLLDHRFFEDVGRDLLHHRVAELHVCHFATAKADRDLDLVAFFQKPAQVAQLDRVVADVGGRTELEFLDLDLLRLLSGGVGFFLLLELEFAKIHDAADGRVAVRLDFNQIEAGFLCHGQRFVARENAYLLSLCANHAHPRNTYLEVPAVRFRFSGDTFFLPRENPYPRRAAQDRALSDSKRFAKSAMDMEPRSSPERTRTETAPVSFSRSPTTRR